MCACCLLFVAGADRVMSVVGTGRACSGVLAVYPQASCAEADAVSPWVSVSQEACVDVANRLVDSGGVCPEVAACIVHFALIDIHPFRDANGRLARIVCNWVLKRCGVPFAICLCSTPDQRLRYVAACKTVCEASRKFAQLNKSSEEGAGAGASPSPKTDALAPLQHALKEAVAVIHAHTDRAWEELERLRLRLVREASDASVAAAVREARRAQVLVCCVTCVARP